jgi:4'-phosphopantetheinyl transferase
MTAMENRVLVWHGSTAVLLTEARRRWLGRLLSPEERGRADRFLRKANRDEFLLAHGMKRVVLSRLTAVPPQDLEFAADHNGRPLLLTRGAGGARIDFNLSHTSGIAAVAASAAGLVGVDVEHAGRSSDVETIMTVLSRREGAHLAGLAGDRRRRAAFAHWTAREAFSKAVGVGLSLPPEDVRFEIPDDGPPGIVDIEPRFGLKTDWQFHQAWITDDHVLAAAIMARQCAPVRWQLQDFRDVADVAMES